MPNITELATTSTFNAVENRIPYFSNLVKKLIITETLMKLKRKLRIIIKINILLFQNFIS